jgi:hypothetical protein
MGCRSSERWGRASLLYATRNVTAQGNVTWQPAFQRAAQPPRLVFPCVRPHRSLPVRCINRTHLTGLTDSLFGECLGSPTVFRAINFLHMNAIYDFCAPILGLGVEPKELTFLQISLRALIVFLATLIMIRFGHKRSLARKTGFDAVLMVILASVLSRAINGSAAFFATLGGGVVLVLVHRLFALIAFHSHSFGILIKGEPELIIDDGDLVLQTMRSNHISKHDVEEDMRLAAKTEDLRDIRKGYVERSGDISFIEK